MLDSSPAGWIKTKQGDVATFFNGRAYKLSEWEKEGTPVIRLQNLTGSGKEFYYSNLKLPPHQYCEQGDLLYMWSASFGAYIWGGERAIYHYHIWKVEQDADKLQRQFHYFLLQYYTEEWKRNANGMAMLHLTKKGMEQLEIKLPPLAEQQRIAEILTSVDDSIRATEAVIAQAERVKRGLMEDLLTGGLGSAAIARGEVPEGWSSKSLEELTYRPISYGVLKPGEYDASGVPMLRIQDAKNGWAYEDIWRISKELDEEFMRTRVNEGDLIFSVVGTLGECKKIDATLDGANVSRAFAVIGVNDAIENDYVFHFLTSDFVLSWVAETGRGGAQKVINLGDLRKLRIPFPSSTEQCRISEILNKSAEQVARNRKIVCRLSTLKRGLMDDLLTGRVRTV